MSNGKCQFDPFPRSGDQVNMGPFRLDRNQLFEGRAVWDNSVGIIGEIRDVNGRYLVRVLNDAAWHNGPLGEDVMEACVRLKSIMEDRKREYIFSDPEFLG